MEDSDDDRLQIDLEASARKRTAAEMDGGGGETETAAGGGEPTDRFTLVASRKKARQGDAETNSSTTGEGTEARARTDDTADKRAKTAYIKGKDRCIVALNSKKVHEEITRDYGRVHEISVGRVSLRVECTSYEQRERLLGMTMLLGHRVGTTKPFEPRQARDVAEPNRPRAQGQRRWEKGVIVGVATDISEDEIKADTGAAKVSRITKRGNEGRAVATTAVILFFDGPRPDSVYLGRRYTVREYIPRTLQCYRCRGFFHTASSCTKEVRCPSCGEGHGHDECPQRNAASVLHCANCGGNHSSAYRECPSFKEARVATRVAVQTGKSYAEALRQVQRETKDEGRNSNSRNDPHPQASDSPQREERAPRGASRALVFPQSSGPAPVTTDQNQAPTVQTQSTGSAFACGFPALMAPQSSASAPITVHENAPGESMALREFEAKATSFVKAMLSLEKRYVHQSLKTNFAMEVQAASFSFFPFIPGSELLSLSNHAENPPAPSPSEEGV